MLRILMLCLWPFAVGADVVDAIAGTARIAAQPDAGEEAARLDRSPWFDAVPLGRAVRVGDVVEVALAGLAAGNAATLVIGFQPFWSGGAEVQEVRLDGAGPWRVMAAVDGPVFLRHTGEVGEVVVDVTGGTVLPLFQQDMTTQSEWQARLAILPDAPFVQMLGPRTVMTLPRALIGTAPIADPQATLVMIDRVVAWQDELAGLDGSAPMHAVSPNRMHYVVDQTATAADREMFYMYAGHTFIGMLDDNTQDLTDPALLAQNWAIWHELGHQQQQMSWTWGSLTEINVNVFSLYVQAQLGLQSRLAEEGVYAQAKAYLAGSVPDYTVDDSETLFIRLVMLDQLRAAYGWQVFTALHRRVREAPLAWDADDAARAAFFVDAICGVTGHDLRAFFARWGLKTGGEVACVGLPAPPVDPASLL